MIKLTYTNQMKQNDPLWETEQEDQELMLKLFEEIVEEAKSKGFKGAVEIYTWSDITIADVYKTEADYELGQLGNIEPLGNIEICRKLIECLEEILNRK